MNRVQRGAFQKQNRCLSPGPRSGSQWKQTWAPKLSFHISLVTEKLRGPHDSLPIGSGAAAHSSFHSHPTGKTGEAPCVCSHHQMALVEVPHLLLLLADPPQKLMVLAATCPANSVEIHGLNKKYRDPVEGADELQESLLNWQDTRPAWVSRRRWCRLT